MKTTKIIDEIAPGGPELVAPGSTLRGFLARCGGSFSDEQYRELRFLALVREPSDGMADLRAALRATNFTDVGLAGAFTQLWRDLIEWDGAWFHLWRGARRPCEAEEERVLVHLLLSVLATECEEVRPQAHGAIQEASHSPRIDGVLREARAYLAKNAEDRACEQVRWFLAECTRRYYSDRVTAADLADCYSEWCASKADGALVQLDLAAWLPTLGYSPTKREQGGIEFSGLQFTNYVPRIERALRAGQVREFLEATCSKIPQFKVLLADLEAAYGEWSQERGIDPPENFDGLMSALGHQSFSDVSGKEIRGLSLKPRESWGLKTFEMFPATGVDPSYGRDRRPGAVWDQQAGRWITYSPGAPKALTPQEVLKQGR